MSKMSTKPVLLCRRCGKPLVVTRLETTVPDEDGSLLHDFMSNLHKIALCKFHQAQRTFYAKKGRLDDWEAGRV